MPGAPRSVLCSILNPSAIINQTPKKRTGSESFWGVIVHVELDAV